jgi:hypothetical protein
MQIVLFSASMQHTGKLAKSLTSVNAQDVSASELSVGTPANMFLKRKEKKIKVLDSESSPIWINKIFYFPKINEAKCLIICLPNFDSEMC